MRHAVRSLCLGALAAMMLLAAPLEAQRGLSGRRGGAQNREQLEQRIRAQMGRMMQQGLDLSEEQADQLSAVVQTFREQERALIRLEQATRRRVEALLLEGGGDDEALQLLTRMADLRAQEAELRANEQAALLEVLSPVQLLEMQSIRDQIGRRIRALGGRGRGDPAIGMRRRGGARGG